MEIPELKADEDIDAILWIGFPGATGIMALGQILTGTDTEGNQEYRNPSVFRRFRILEASVPMS